MFTHRNHHRPRLARLTPKFILFVLALVGMGMYTFVLRPGLDGGNSLFDLDVGHGQSASAELNTTTAAAAAAGVDDITIKHELTIEDIAEQKEIDRLIGIDLDHHLDNALPIDLYYDPAPPDHVAAKRVRDFNARLQKQYPATKTAVRSTRTFSFKSLDRLASCLEAGTCGPNERRIILLGNYFFGYALEGKRGGEHVWAASTMRAFEAFNYTMVLGFGHMETLFIYQALPDMVDLVFWHEDMIKACMERNDDNYAELEKQYNEDPGDWQTGPKYCTATEMYPDGVPLWKSFAYYFWLDGPKTPLGNKWTLVTYPAEGKPYPLGYSIEHQCNQVPMPVEKQHRAFVLGKANRYFFDPHNVFTHALNRAAAAAGGADFALISTAVNRPGDDVPDTIPGITSLGFQTQEQFAQLVATSKVMIGIGSPFLSPSPFEALCLGTPFINPIIDWDYDHPDDRSQWKTQHNALIHLDPPYVYHVYNGNGVVLEKAIKAALENPIGRFVPEEMRWKNVLVRHAKLIATDWKDECYKEVADGDHWMCIG